MNGHMASSAEMQNAFPLPPPTLTGRPRMDFSAQLIMVTLTIKLFLLVPIYWGLLPELV